MTTSPPASQPPLITGPLTDEQLNDAWKAYRTTLAADQTYKGDLVVFDKFRLDSTSTTSLPLFIFRQMAQDQIRTLAKRAQRVAAPYRAASELGSGARAV